MPKKPCELSRKKTNLAIGDANLVQSGVTELIFTGGEINTPYDGKVQGTNIDHHGNADYDNGTAHAYNEVNGSMILLNAPANSRVVFIDLTINGYYNFIDSARNKNLTLEFINCTFNGGWVGQTNGLANIKFTGCTFTLDGVDTVNVKNTNPLWLATTEDQTVTLTDCTIEGNRPIKIDGTGSLTITGCTFDLTPTAYDTATGRLDRLTAVRFDAGLTVHITGNTMVAGYAFYQTNQSPYADPDFADAGNGNSKPADTL